MKWLKSGYMNDSIWVAVIVGLAVTSFSILLFWCATLHVAYAEASLDSANEQSKMMQYVLWQDQPIVVELPVNESRSLIFPHSVNVGLSKALQDKVKIENHAGIVKLTAKKPFMNGRIAIKDPTQNKTVLIDLSAAAHQTTAPLAIFYQKPSEQLSSKTWLKTPNALSGDMAFVTLTRYAEQQLYAPKRLLKNPYGIQLLDSFVNQRGQVDSHLWFDGLFLDRSTMNIPWAEWSSGENYVTAVLVRNQLNVPIDLTRNLTNICGREEGVWKTITFFPSWHLAKAGDPQDTSVAFLVSAMPFDQARKLCGG